MVLAVLWGCHLLVELGSAKHHPQKRHIPRQAGRAQAFKMMVCLGFFLCKIGGYFVFRKGVEGKAFG